MKSAIRLVPKIHHHLSISGSDVAYDVYLHVSLFAIMYLGVLLFQTHAKVFGDQDSLTSLFLQVLRPFSPA